MGNLKMDDSHQFKEQCLNEIQAMSTDDNFRTKTAEWIEAAASHKYTHHFSWLGLPIIQFPQDVLAMQEIIWKVKPDLIVETGIARGGSLVFYASMLELNAACGGPQIADVIGVDIDIRDHNRIAIESHPMGKRIIMVEGSSIEKRIVDKVHRKAGGKQSVLVCLDSMHTHDHVLAELQAYAPLVTPDSYCVVFDTLIEDMPDDFFSDRPWGKRDNPKTAVWEFLKTNNDFIDDKNIEKKFLITTALGGYLKRLK
jgi:cephalosporin hydroxylase